MYVWIRASSRTILTATTRKIARISWIVHCKECVSNYWPGQVVSSALSLESSDETHHEFCVTVKDFSKDYNVISISNFENVCRCTIIYVWFHLVFMMHLYTTLWIMHWLPIGHFERSLHEHSLSVILFVCVQPVPVQAILFTFFLVATLEYFYYFRVCLCCGYQMLVG